jgi:Bacterial Ig-like domain
MKKMMLLATLVHLLISLWACSFIEEIIHNSIPKVTNCSLETDHFLLKFSTAMNRNITEQAFKLSFEDSEVEGRFSWNDKNMQFYPHQEIIEKGLYILKIESSAEDEYGNSLIRAQSWEFNTREDCTSPQIISVLPTDQSEISNVRQPVSYIFSESIDPMTFRDALDISPSLEYRIEWSEKDGAVQIHPLENFSEGEEYKFSVKTQLQDLAGNKLEQEHISHYKITSKDELILESLVLESSSAELEVNVINEYLEKNDFLHGRFSRSPDSDESYGLVRIQPDVSFNIHWDVECIGFTLYFTEALEYGEIYDLYILDRKYTVMCNGEGSLPIKIEALSFCPEEGVEPQQILSLNESLSAYDSDTAILEFTLSHSPLGDINQSSFMSAFSAESSVLSFKFISLERKEGPLPGQSLIKIKLKITDTAFPGTVRFSLDNTLHDSLENSLNEAWAMTVNQP